MEIQSIVFGLAESGSTPVTVTVSSQGFHLAPEEDFSPVVMAFGALQVTSGGDQDKYLVFECLHKDKTLSLYLPRKEAFQALKQQNLPESLRKALAQAGKDRQQRSLKRIQLGVMALSLVGLCFVGLWLSLGLVGNWVVSQIPLSMEQKLGKSASAQVLQKKKVCRNPELNRMIREIGHRLVRAYGQQPYKFTFQVLDDKSINAFALPGGHIFFNVGLIRKAASAEEVAGVMAHEIQHVLQRHGLKNVVKSIGWRILVVAVFQMTDSALLAHLTKGASSLLQLSFSRSQEREADAKGYSLLRKTKINPDGMAQFFSRLEKLRKLPNHKLVKLLSTHPGSADRAQAIRSRIVRDGKQEIRPLPYNWKTLRKQTCQP